MVDLVFICEAFELPLSPPATRKQVLALGNSRQLFPVSLLNNFSVHLEFLSAAVLNALRSASAEAGMLASARLCCACKQPVCVAAAEVFLADCTGATRSPLFLIFIHNIHLTTPECNEWMMWV